MMRYGSSAAAWLLLIWAVYAWFHGNQEKALLVLGVFALGIPFLAYHVWREFRRDYRAEVLEELEREQEQRSNRQAGRPTAKQGQDPD
jgi:hypothetical protein